jgi:hypothetical protein
MDIEKVRLVYLKRSMTPEDAHLLSAHTVLTNRHSVHRITRHGRAHTRRCQERGLWPVNRSSVFNVPEEVRVPPNGK